MKSYKRYIAPILLAVSIAGFSACNKKLDVAPGSYINPDQVKDESDVNAELMGAYANLQHYDAYGERGILIPDLLANEGELSFVGTFLPYRQIEAKSQLRTSGIAEGIWQRGYKIINNLNIVIGNINLVSEDNKKAVEGEARFIRGLVYFHLANLYGKPYSAGAISTNLTVPLILDPIVEEKDLPKGMQARATVEAIHKQVLLDLQFAAENLPERNTKGRATKYSAYAVLSRVYMAEGLYREAATAADAVIASKAFVLAPSFDKVFNNASNSPEDIFAIQQTNQSNAGTSDNGLQTFYASRANGGRGDILADLSKLPYGATDDRKGFSYTGRGITGVSGLYSTKWKEQYKVYTVVRLAEMYLTRAESNLRAGTSIGATPLEDVNKVRVRANTTPLVAVTAADVVEERLRELVYEGDKLWTYKRLKMNVGTRKYDDDKLVLPIPQRETDVNSKLTQNPGY